jgi:hypothetical protein
VRLARLLASAAAFALVTALLGWLAVPALGAVLGAVAGRRVRAVRGAGSIAAAAALGWAGLLAVDAARAPLWPLARRLGGVMTLPPVALLGVTLAFAALLAWSAAVLGAALGGLRGGGGRGDSPAALARAGQAG